MRPQDVTKGPFFGGKMRKNTAESHGKPNIWSNINLCHWAGFVGDCFWLKPWGYTP